MSLTSKWRKLRLLPRVLAAPPAAVLLLSHMRSRSTLLAHILDSARAIQGHTERHRPYTGGLSLLKLRLDVIEEMGDRGPTHVGYVLDKVLHNHLTIASSVLSDSTVRPIVLVRRPRPSIESIIRMGGVTGLEWQRDARSATAYYTARVSALESYAEQAGRRAFYLESDDLIDHPEACLREMSVWLGLDEELRPEYEVFPDTGKAFLGDMSAFIREGRITATRHAPATELAGVDLTEADAAYERLRSRIARLSTSS